MSARYDHCGLIGFQDSIDLFLGNFAVEESDGPTPLRVQKDWKFLTVSIFLSLVDGTIIKSLAIDKLITNCN